MATRKEARKNIEEKYFMEFSRPFAEWLSGIGEEYRKSGRWLMGLSPFLLVDMYKTIEDKTAAALLSLIVSQNRDTMMSQVMQLKNMIGESPDAYLRNGLYLTIRMMPGGAMMPGAIRKKKDDVIALCASIAQIMDDFGDINRAVENVSTAMNLSVADAIRWLLKGNDDAVKDTQIDILAIYLSVKGLISQQMIGNVGCPITKSVKDNMKRLVPLYPILCDFDEACGLLGLDNRLDFFFVSGAYDERKKTHPEEMTWFERRYAKWYRVRIDVSQKQYRYMYEKALKTLQSTGL